MSHTYRFTVTGTTITDITAQAHQEATRYFPLGDYEIEDIDAEGSPIVNMAGNAVGINVEANVVTRHKPPIATGRIAPPPGRPTTSATR